MTDQAGLVAWVDLETDAIEPEPQILEIGVILTDHTPALNEIDRINIVCHYDLHPPHVDPTAWPQIKPVVYDMHTGNGLWDDCAASTVVEAAAEEQLLVWLDMHGATSTHIPFGGSGVGHYDSRVLQSRMPALRARFTYWTYDIGCVRRFVALGDTTDEWPVHEDDKPHRAMGDIELHVTEARYFLAGLTR